MSLITMAIGLIGVPFAVFVAWAIGFMGWRIPASIGWIPSTLALVLGFLGVWMGSNTAVHAAATASAEMRMTLIASGVQTALSSQLASTGTGALGFVAFAFAACIPAALVVGPGGHFNFSSTLASIAGAIVGGIASAIALIAVVGVDGYFDAGIGALTLPPLAIALTVGIVFASLRESDEREDQGRIGGSRMAILAATLLGLLLLGEALRLQGVQHAFMAVASASPEMKAPLMQKGLEIATLPFTIALCLCLMPLAASIGGMMGVLGRADSAEFLGAAVAGLQIMVIVASLIIGGARMQVLFQLLFA